MNGWCGNILHIDLTSRTTRVEHPSLDTYTKWVGGKGLAGTYLQPHITRAYDDPEMPLIFMTGPLVNTPSPTSGRLCVSSRSPLTGTVGDTSVGGTLGTQIKKAGWDGIVITGRAETLCGIWIDNHACTFEDASPLQGATTDTVTERLKDRGSVVCIGPAAEHGVRFACIVIDGDYFAGRNGLGLVSAAKNLKYMTVKGSGTTPVHDPDELKGAREEIFRLIAASPILLGELGITNFGTGALYDLMDTRHMMPTDNFRKTRFDSAGAMNAYHYRDTYGMKKAGCRGCHILCKKRTRDGRSIPEFETMSHFSALLGNTDMEAVVEANRLCNVLGMDTISTAATLACYSEITGEPVTGDRLPELIDAIGTGRAVDPDLVLGSSAYARAKGRPDAAIAVKGQELAAYDPRGAYGMALAYATSTRGGCHLRAYPISHEILRKPVATDRFSFGGKARIVKIAEDMNAMVDSLTACKFVFLGASLEEFARAYTAVTGIASSAQELIHIGERIYYHDRIMNTLNGFDAADDDLPERFFTEPGTGGPGFDVPPLDRGEFLAARARYYRIRGLDDTGRPTRERAEALGLEWND
ncbi:MAG TPA: aldehyde ferredoxin oxidoreductase family protein [bacterium]|nr:aldehyde ferredoxin oxidoreductase family protein [bacterium]